MVTQDPLIVDRTLEKGAGFVISDNNLALYRKPIVTSSAAGRILVTVVKKLQLKQITSEIETGLKNREIAQALYISEKTVKNHISNILSRLNLRDRTQVAILAMQSNLQID